MTKETRKLKSSINKNCVDYINQHDGFTIMGTIALGRKRDPNNPGVLVDSDVPTYCICYLFPTNQKIIDEKEYQCMMYELKT
jgi:pullulanase/glycogen debranching enzyme